MCVYSTGQNKTLHKMCHVKIACAELVLRVLKRNNEAKIVDLHFSLSADWVIESSIKIKIKKQ